MNLKLLSLCALAAAVTLPASASTHVGIGISIGVPPPIIVHRAPPTRVTEVVVASPGNGYVWVPGHYTWQNQWVWVPGAWVTPPQPGAVGVDGRWDPQAQAWTEGHWEIASGPAPVAVAPAGEVIIAAPPPPIRHEWRGHRPGRDYVWISGYWAWDHGRHVWVAGHWAVPPRGYVTWVEPRWEHRGHGYVFLEGHWR